MAKIWGYWGELKRKSSMTIVASILFLAAIAISIFAIFGSIGENMPRILEVIEERNVAERQPRKITVGTLRTTSAHQLANVIPMKLRQPVGIAARKPTLHQGIAPAVPLSLAA
jgi:hypothetical protein